MQVEWVSAVPGSVAKTQIILIPGASHGPDDCRREGFLAAVHTRHLNVDIALVKPELAHLTDRSLLARLHTEIILPARASGCDTIWLAGISLGGYFGLLYAASYPAGLDGLCLLAPYLGNRMITAEICRFESLADWNSQVSDAPDELAEERRLWRYIATQPHPPRVRFLGYGRRDRFASMQRLLADRLPPSAVTVIDGGHDWPIWRQLWGEFLNQLAGGTRSSR